MKCPMSTPVTDPISPPMSTMGKVASRGGGSLFVTSLKARPVINRPTVHPAPAQPAVHMTIPTNLSSNVDTFMFDRLGLGCPRHQSNQPSKPILPAHPTVPRLFQHLPSP